MSIKKIKTSIFLALYTILIGLSTFFLVNLGKDNISQINAATVSKSTVVITNTGSSQTNYDVLVELDTATMISGGTLQSDCDDIRFYDSDDSTPLNYWIESGCNTTTTQIWVTVPSIANGTKNIYFHYNDPAMANGEQSWAGNFILLNNTTCPAGWTRNTSFDSRFPYGAATYGGTGGGSHTHSFSFTSGGNTGGSYTENWWSTPSTATNGHTHTGSGTTGSVTNLPPYLNMVFCQKSDLDITTNLIALYESTAPTNWTRFTALDSKFPQGASSYGGTGGSSTATGHSYSGTTSGPSANFVGDYTQTPYLASGSHTHTYSGATNTTSDVLPPYLNMVYIQAGSSAAVVANLITMSTAVPPLGWTLYTNLSSKFPQGAATYGSTGGASTHTHSFSGSLNNSTSSVESYRGAWPSTQAAAYHPHSHSFSGTTGSGSSLPAYLNTIFIKRNNPAGAGVSASTLATSCAPDPNDTTHTITTDCSFSSSLGTDANGKTIYGMDPGSDTTNSSTLTVNSGTLTITTSDHLALGSIAMTGGSIAVATGGKITVGGVIYYPDADADGYPASTTGQVAFSAPANHRRRSLLASIVTSDCNDNSYDLTNSCCVAQDWYPDSDGDGYGNSSSSPTSQCSPGPSNYVTNNTDCYDSNANAYPGSSTCSSTNRGDGSYDYNCSGSNTICGTALASSYSQGYSCSVSNCIWVPGCGICSTRTNTYYNYTLSGSAGCGQTGYYTSGGRTQNMCVFQPECACWNNGATCWQYASSTQTCQ